MRPCGIKGLNLGTFSESKQLEFSFTSLQEKKLDEALAYNNGHICKGHPTEFTEFYLQSAESSEFFRGTMEVKVTLVKSATEDSTEYPSYHFIVFDTTEGSQPPVSDAKVTLWIA